MKEDAIDQRERVNWLFNRDDPRQGTRRQLAAGLSARIFVGSNSMLSIVRIEAHSRGIVHSHPEEQWGILLEGACTRIQGGYEVLVKKGDFWHTPGNVAHGIFTNEEEAIVLDVFSPPRPEYRLSGTGFGQAG